jgi:hypothetical protein
VAKKRAQFDEKLGAAFLDSVPTSPGVYEWQDAAGQTLYVGKAKDLRKRLRQYRNATRRKATRKQWEIVRAAASLRLHTTDTELAALLRENELIQTLRPPLNLSGAFHFMYPAIGLRRRDHELDLVCTTTPDAFDGFVLAGVFRSPAGTRAAFESLVALLGHLGHVEPSRRVTDVPKIPFSRVVRLRRLPETLDGTLLALLRGGGKRALRPLVLALLEHPDARRRREATQEHLESLTRFSLEECEPLRAVLLATGKPPDALLAQCDRDRTFLSAKLPMSEPDA